MMLSTYAAVAANTSARLAFVTKPTNSAKVAVKDAIMPSRAVSFVTRYRPQMGPMSRIAAARMSMVATAIFIDFSL